MSEMKQVILNKKNNTIFINMVDAPPADPDEVAMSAQQFIAGFEKEDYLW